MSCKRHIISSLEPPTWWDSAGWRRASVAKDTAEIGCMPVTPAIALGSLRVNVGVDPSLFAPASQHTDEKIRRKQLLSL